MTKYDWMPEEERITGCRCPSPVSCAPPGLPCPVHPATLDRVQESTVERAGDTGGGGVWDFIWRYFRGFGV